MQSFIQSMTANYSTYLTRFNNLKLDKEAGDTALQRAVMQKQNNPRVTSRIAVPSKLKHRHRMRKKLGT